jgi:hypothetical protein
MGFTLRTPEYPNGRKQKAIFYQVTQFTRTYLSANSGAGIGEALPLFFFAWINESHPEKGFNYLYLSQEIYLKLQDGKRDLTSSGWLRTMWAGAATQDYGRHRSRHFSHCTICWYRSLSYSSREVSSLSGRTTNYPDSSVAP